MNRNNCEYRANARNVIRIHESENRGFWGGFVEGFCGVGRSVGRLATSVTGIATSVAGLKSVGKILVK